MTESSVPESAVTVVEPPAGAASSPELEEPGGHRADPRCRRGRQLRRVARARDRADRHRAGELGGHVVPAVVHARQRADAATCPATSGGSGSTGGSGGRPAGATCRAAVARPAARAASTSTRSPARSARSIVNINTTLDGGEAAGTGMIISSSGEVLTNNHVINGATSVSVELANGSTKTAKVLGYSATDDVALIKIEGVSNLPTITHRELVDGVGRRPGARARQRARQGRLAHAGRGHGGRAQPDHHRGRRERRQRRDAHRHHPARRADPARRLRRPARERRRQGRRGELGGVDQQRLRLPRLVVDRDRRLRDHHRQGARPSSSRSRTAPSTDTVHIGDRGILGVSIQSDTTFGGRSSGSGNGAAVAGVQSGSPAADAGIERRRHHRGASATRRSAPAPSCGRR